MHVTRKVVKHLGKYKKIYAYYDENNRQITGPGALDYFKSLKIPPGYKDVQINLNKNAKVLAIGTDTKGRKQYIYNKKWIERQTREKNCNMINFGLQLPAINQAIDKYINQKEMDKNKLVALILKIIMACNFRIGNKVFKELYQTFGISTITKKQININRDSSVTINFVGKRGVNNNCLITDKKLGGVIGRLYRDTKSKNENIFSYRKDGRQISVNSQDVNDFLKEFGDFSSKDFRTWFANVGFLKALDLQDRDMSGGTLSLNERKKNVREAIKKVAADLHHTTAICKKNYIDNNIIDCYLEEPGVYNQMAGKKRMYHKKLDRNSNLFIGFLRRYCDK